MLCILIFALFRLYGGVWRYAGINVMNRIIGASLATCVLQIVGTCLFIRRIASSEYGDTTAIGVVGSQGQSFNYGSTSASSAYGNHYENNYGN